MIHCNQLRFAYGSEFCLNIDEFHVAAGETVALVGPSGCGKTTLLMLLAGILQADSGHLRVAGQSLPEMSDKSRRLFRAQSLGLIFQDFELIEYLTVRENILLPLNLGISRAPSNSNDRREIETLLDTLLAETGLPAKRHAMPAQLSQGQRQRVAICRALITRPKLILADEPTGSLDAEQAAIALNLLMRAVKQQNATLVMVTHDSNCLPRFDRVIQLDDIVSQHVSNSGGLAEGAQSSNRGEFS